ncbi:MAG: hypothetical protein A2481_02025 [Candidatus Yonathbacteria bacterium RIFOXYC2_FULL_47_9]|nr:MAG: hypothetical protein A2481_02025 [Candidatus Yonathbacteria bacterium RIFOXYC2_FULL_47_9]HAT68015.1 hypothetical protein [Candidatus Yonathbacteria bacterium]
MELDIPERVCFIIPPSIFLLDERVFMSLGVLRVAAVLEQAGTVVEVLDLSGVSNFNEVAEEHARSSKATIFGFTATTPQLPAVTEVVHTIKRIRPNVKTILGGPHVTLVNAAYKNEIKQGINGRAVRAMQKLEGLFGTLLAGDGEEAIFLACKADAPKLVDADDPKSILFLDNARLNALPFPARHLVDVESYHYSIEGVPAISLIAQLGCPFNCGFCGGRESPMLRRIRTRTSENIVEEMVHIYKTTGHRGFMFYDDELNVNKKVVELMDLIAKTQRDLGTTWRLRGFVKSELFTDAQAESMYNAGFRWLLTGFESGSPRILQNINKKATREENTRCVEIAHRHGLKVKALMSIGHPGESLETIRDTEEWLLEVRPADFDVTIITCYPGTPYYDHAVPDGVKPGIWTYTCPKTEDKLHQIELDYTETTDYYKGKPDGGYKSYVFTDFLTPEELVSERDRIERNVREVLNIPFYQGSEAIRYEHSMGQSGGGITPNILRMSRS